MIEIYGKENCPFCDMAKQLCDDFTREEMIEKFPFAKTFPQIIIDGEYCGGYTELNEWNRLQ
jgi:glutaredoxin